jgi:hypothetical protein
MTDKNRTSRRFRLLATATLTLVLLVALAAVGSAATDKKPSASQYQYGKKTTVCHKGKKTIVVGARAARAHLRHGDSAGPCSADRARPAKAKAKDQARAKDKATAKAKTKAKADVPAATDAAPADKPAKGKAKGKEKKGK